MRIFSFIICTLILSACCGLKMDCKDFNDKVKVIDMTGLDGCGLMLELGNGERLEPINIADFNLEEGDEVYINYGIRNDLGSICMAGMMVEIKDLCEPKVKASQK